MSLVIPLYVFLIIYLIFLGVFGFIAICNCQQLLQYGTKDRHTKSLLAAFVIVTTVILFFSLVMIFRIDWTQTLVLSQSAVPAGL